ncbi:hypothetical protein KC926_01065 [Candidatus Kaiserbacteria bacterium]|nr:hypothetical protein [Candidatus Kaiserbacteria bacterium]
MSYNNHEFPRYMRTAGKITVVTALAGLLVFVMAFVFDFGSKELSKVSAQTATTTLTVLNTPPSFVIDAYEVTESSTSTPTNSGDAIVWSALGGDSNGAPYFLLICSTNASPTANAAADIFSLGTAAPACGGGVQWGVSTATVSNTLATVSTTTTEAAPFAEVNTWFAWVCDDDPSNPRCNTVPVQGYSATNSSPFHVNSRPVLNNFANNGPVDPAGVLTFFSTSSDPDIVGGEDSIYLVVCQTNTDYNPVTNTCDSNFLASTTITVLSDASATFTLPAIIRDDTYPAYGYIVDSHGHEASANPLQANFDVNNVAPTVLSAEVELYGVGGVGTDLTLSVPAGETPGSVLNFTIHDANSCLTAASTTDEIAGFTALVYRTDIGTTTCNGTGANYNPNNCYDSAVATTTWNLSCTATSTCASPTQDYMDYSCTFPLWFVADPTDSGTPAAQDATTWSAAISGIDDDGASSTIVATAAPVELISYLSINILATEIVYGGIEPGNDTGTLIATSTIVNEGNTGIDQEIQGESMCGTFTPATECPVSATSTIPESEQKFGTSTLFAYAGPEALTLSSSTAQELEINVNQTSATSTQLTKDTYWGIAVPITITLAGNYTGLNTFVGKIAEPADW